MEIQNMPVGNNSLYFNKMIENLIRDSERLRVVTAYVKKERFLDREILFSLLGLKPEKEEDAGDDDK